MPQNKLLLLLLAACMASPAPAQEQAPSTDTDAAKAEFSYDPLGQSKWKDLPGSEKCGNGRKQSPIDIAQRTEDPNLKLIEFSYRTATPLKFAANAYNFKVDCKDSGNYITIRGQKFKLQEFHFHRPAEE